MEPLRIKAKQHSPEVDFDPTTKRLSITGICHPENVTKFFAPVTEWLDGFYRLHQSTNDNKPIVLIFFFIYFNSATYKYLLTLLQTLKQFQDLGVPVSLEWYYEPEDEEMRDSCTELFEFSELDIPFKCIEADDELK